MGSLRPESEIDPARLAALLDGRLTGDERRSLLARLAASEEWAAVYADATAALGAEQPAAGELRPSAGSSRIWRWSRGSQFLTAAASIAVILVGAYWMLGRQPRAADPVSLAVGHLASPDQGLFAGWEDRGWSTTRGSGVPRSDAARAARVGALSVDLELALRSGDSAARALARDIGVLLRDLPASAPVVSLYDAISAGATGSSGTDVEAAARARPATIALLDAKGFADGALVEAARIAASRRDTAFFASHAGRELVSLARSHTEISPPLTDNFAGQLRGPAFDWTTLSRSIREMLIALTR